ncbi:hypothetical protein X975_16982, partial [Stegodyphus mimosarum]
MVTKVSVSSWCYLQGSIKKTKHTKVVLSAPPEKAKWMPD